ncbi:MAG: DNA polymerase I [Planctomycetaceae bacterium]|nr:DNA polymerase I [Planctomycetaceae bacterium]
MPDCVYLVDTFSLMFQVFHAIRAPMTGKQGQPTNAVYGFTRDLIRLLRDEQPSHLICAMDSPGSGTRTVLYPEYKANRTEIPPDLAPQIPLIQQVIEGFRIPAVSLAEWEADDVIATLTRQAVELGMEVRIVSADKDCRQLLGPQVQIFNIRKNSYLDVDGLIEDWGVRPEQVIDFQALVGDSVDNVPGVPLVGPKKAQALLEQHGTLEEVLAHPETAKGKKLQENLKTFAEQALLSRELVTLNQHLELEFDWEAARVCEPDRECLLELFTELAFGRLTDEMRALTPGGSPDGAATEDGSPPAERTWDTIDTPEKFATFLAQLEQQQAFCVDLETTGLNAARVDIVGWAFCWQAGHAYYLPVDGPPGQPTLEGKAVCEALRPILEDPDRRIANQNLKYDMIVLLRAGIELAGVGMDPMIGDYLLDAGARTHKLDSLAERYLQHRMIPITELIGKGKQQIKMFEVDIDRTAEYATEDADIAWQLAERIEAELHREGLWELYQNLERPLIPVLARMQYRGIRLNAEELREQSAELATRLEELVGQIYAEAGHEFNIDSPMQLRVVLFDELNLPVQKKTKTGPSTDQEVLEKLAPLHPLPKLITEHRQLSKLRGTYLEALPALVNPETGRIHASFNQVVAATGRLSSSEPNLQNIPIRTEEGRRVRRGFVPGDAGWQLICADYSQIELRMLAQFSGDEAMRAAFTSGEDIHRAVAAQVFGVDPADVDRDMRRIAKAVNFGVIYGQSAFGLAAALGIGQAEAAAFIEGYFEKYSGVRDYLEQVLEETAASGFATTILGRRRAIAGIRAQRKSGQLTLPERTAINTVIQGSAADLIKRAMIAIDRRLGESSLDAFMLLQIHDELVFEAAEADVPATVELVRAEMESALELEVPLVVDVTTGPSWYDQTAYGET